MKVYVRKLSGFWYARVTWVDANGKRHEKNKSTLIECNDEDNRGKKAAEEYAAAWARKLNISDKGTSNGATMTLYAYCRAHYATLQAMGHIEGRTAAGYKTSLNYLDQYFGEKKIGEITTAEVESFIQWLTERGLSNNTIKKTFNVLHHCVRQAVAVRDIEWDYCAAIKPPKRQLPPPNPLDEPSRKKLLFMLENLEKTPYVVACYLAYYTGMRRGEICGLRWCDVELTPGSEYINVRQAVSIEEGGTYVKLPKTNKERRIPIPASLAAILKERRAGLLEDCMLCGISFEPAMYVCGDVEGHYLHPSPLSKWWQQHAKEWGLMGTQKRRPVFHDLRHTFATIAVRATDPKTAQDILGHADINMTMRYADTTTEQLEKARNPLASALGESKDTGAKVEEFPRKAANF